MSTSQQHSVDSTDLMATQGNTEMIAPATQDGILATPDNTRMALSASMDTQDGIVINAPHSENMSISWSAAEGDVFKQHLEYHRQMGEYVNDLLNRGNQGQKAPLKPEISLSDLLKKKALPRKKKMTPTELHQYLCTYEAQYVSTEWIPQHTQEWLSIEQDLNKGYNYLKYINNGCLKVFLQFGEKLNLAYRVFLRQKDYDYTWKEWLKTRIGIDDSYARKLRKVAKVLVRYPRFKRLHITFSEIYKHLPMISEMLLDSEIHTYWTQ